MGNSKVYCKEAIMPLYKKYVHKAWASEKNVG